MAVAERTFGGAAGERVEGRAGAHALALPLVEVAAGLAIFAVTLFVYNATLTPSLSYVSLDGNELATVPYQLGLAHPTGYPLYTWAGKLFTYLPIGDVAHRTNLMSAAGAAGGSALLFAIVVMVIRASEGLILAAGSAAGGPWSAPSTSSGRSSGRAGIGRSGAGVTRLLRGADRWLPLAGAAVGALLFAFSRTLWSQAVIAEVYAPNIFMVGLSFALLLTWGGHERRRVALSRQYQADAKSLALFGAFALAFGLSLGTHMSDLALAPGFVAFILLTNWRLALQPKFALAGAAGFGLGLLQFLWLPYKAGKVNDAALARNTPNDLQGIYNYTLNAFPQLKWSVPWALVPDRVVMYMGFMRENFGLGGMALAGVGGLAMAWRNPRAFFLFVPAYIFETAFFLEYRASDIDVFFITSHFITAVFIGYGVWALGEGAIVTGTRLWHSAGGQGVDPEAALTSDDGRASRVRLAVALRRNPAVSRWGSRLALAVLALVAVVVLAQPVVSLARNWGGEDQSANTGINDFYDNVFETLPQNATLVGRGGVFGYDMFYWRYVYNVRPDVYIPLAIRFDNSRAQQNSQTFTISPPGGQGGFGGPSPAPRGLQSQNAWYVPVISAPVETDDTAALEMSRQLTLFESQTQAPQMFATGVTPQNEVNYNFGAATLAGYDVSSTSVAPGGTVHLKLYWRTNGAAAPQVSTKIGDTKYFEAHQLGFGNLSRYLQTQGQQAAGSMLVEEYDLVVLSSLDKGGQLFQVRVSGGAFGQSQSQWVIIGKIEVK